MPNPPQFTWNSSNPLQVGEELFTECQIGLDSEIVSYIKQSNEISLRVSGEPFYYFQRVPGAIITGNVSTYTQTSPYIGTLWVPADGEFTHPDIRLHDSDFILYNNGVPMTRVYEVSYINSDTEYCIVVDVGVSSATKNVINVYFNDGFIPGDITFTSNSLCSCVDIESGYPNRQCTICKGTSTPFAYTQYKCAGSQYTPTNTVLVRVPLVAETAGVTQIGRVLSREYRHWAGPAPYLSNYDLIVGTIGNNIGNVYEIKAKLDSRMRGILLHQAFDTILIERDDIRYSITPETV